MQGAIKPQYRKEVTTMTDDAQFVCEACNIDYSGKKEVMTNCRMCGRLHCSDCVDEFGRCVECSSKSADKFTEAAPDA
jgi:hypothetical protein